MKKNLILLAGMAVLISAVSCSIEESNIDPIPTDPRVPMTFTAGEFTKTSLDPGNENAVYWSEGDAISIFDGTNNNEFTLTEGAGTASAKFEGEAVPDKTYYALYPYSASAEFNGTVITSSLPAEQQYVGATFDTMLNPSVAVADENNNLAFHNVASILQINVSGLQSKSVREIQISADKSLTGEYTVDMSGNAFSASASGTEISGVRLLVDSADMETDPNFNGRISCYAVVLPGTYANLKISVIYSDNSYSERSYQDVTLVASDGNYVNVDASQATANEQGLYGLYQAGVDIEIGGKLYNKSEYGDATLISSDTEITGVTTETHKPNHSELTQINPSNNDGIYFIEPEITVYMNYAGAMRRFFLIGNDIETRSTVIPEVYFRTNASKVENGELLIYNVDIDYSSTTLGYLITQNNDAAGIVRIIDSRVSLPAKPLIYCSAKGRSYSEIDLQGNIFKLKGTTTVTNFIGMADNTATMPSIIFKNNIFYAAEVINNYVLYAGTSSTIEKIVLENNTFVNINSGTAALFRYGALNEVELRNNLVYLDTQASGVCFFRPGTATPIDPTPIDPDNPKGPVTNPVYKENPQKGFCEASIFYSADASTHNKQWFYSGMNRVELETEIEFRVPEESPFANLKISSEIFEPTAEYASYGAQR